MLKPYPKLPELPSRLDLLILKGLTSLSFVEKFPQEYSIRDNVCYEPYYCGRTAVGFAGSYFAKNSYSGMPKMMHASDLTSSEFERLDSRTACLWFLMEVAKGNLSTGYDIMASNGYVSDYSSVFIDRGFKEGTIPSRVIMPSYLRHPEVFKSKIKDIANMFKTNPYLLS